MSKTIQVRLDPKSIEAAIKEIQKYRDEVETKAKLLVERLAKMGAEIARIKIVEMGAYYSGELYAGVDGYFDYATNTGYVKVASDHAAFVEFGTGIKGYIDPHKNGEYLSKASWDYGSGKTIFNTADGRVGWYFPLGDGTWRFTEGMPSRPFMYETSLLLQREYQRIAKEVFGK